MSVANLTGTAWRFNETITLSGAVFDINFINNNHSYQYTDVDSNAFAYGNDDYVYVYTMANGWINESYRTIEITGGTDATSQTAIDWFEANAVQILPIIGNPLTLGSGSGGSGGTVTITDTQDAAGGTVRTITTSPAATIVEALIATANTTYTPAAGHAYGPVTVNVSGAGGLVYEAGTYTPTADISGPTISFTNQHSTMPIFVAMADATGDAPPDNSLEIWIYYDAWQVGGDGFYHVGSKKYGLTRYAAKTSGSSGTNSETYFSHNSDDTGDLNSQYPRYSVTPSGFKPARWTTTYLWRANRSYKWIAVWGA